MNSEPPGKDASQSSEISITGLELITARPERAITVKSAVFKIWPLISQDFCRQLVRFCEKTQASKISRIKTT